jgi:TNF receptor-associated protein 1
VKDVYYLAAPSRELAEQSPYFEAFKKKGVEVLFMYQTLDEVALRKIETYNGRKLVSAETAKVEIPDDPLAVKTPEQQAEAERQAAVAASKRLKEDEAVSVASWLQETLSKRVSAVKVTDRLETSPAIVTEHEGLHRRLSRALMVDTDESAFKEQLEINPGHPIITGLSKQRHANPALAAEVAEQLYYNALVAAGLVPDARIMLARLNKLLTVAAHADATAAASVASTWTPVVNPAAAPTQPSGQPVAPDSGVAEASVVGGEGKKE